MLTMNGFLSSQNGLLHWIWADLVAYLGWLIECKERNIMGLQSKVSIGIKVASITLLEIFPGTTK